jgi:hypothetical protein
VHVPCAYKQGFKASVMNKMFTYYCDDHLSKLQAEEKEKDENVQGDISKGRELIPINLHGGG